MDKFFLQEKPKKKPKYLNDGLMKVDVRDQIIDNYDVEELLYGTSNIVSKAKTSEEKINALDIFIERLCRKLIPEAGLRVTYPLISKIVKTMAENVALPLNYTKLGSVIDTTGPTVKTYMKFLEDLDIITEVPAIEVETKRKLMKSSKLYFNDTGLVSRLLGLKSEDELKGHIRESQVWENFVFEKVNAALPRRYHLEYYMLHTGPELSLVICDSKRKLIAGIDVVINASLFPSKHQNIISDDLKQPRTYMVHQGQEVILINPNLLCVGLDHFIHQVIPSL